jgi:hypothetical protein
VFAFHKFRYNLLGNNFLSYVDHMALVYSMNKLKVSSRTMRWLVLFLEYEFIVIYKLGCTQVVVNALFKLPNITRTNMCTLSNHVCSFVSVTIGLVKGGQRLSINKTCV